MGVHTNMILGIGALGLIDKDKTVTDGTSFYKVLAPSLLTRFFRRKPEVNYVAGYWWIVGQYIIKISIWSFSTKAVL